MKVLLFFRFAACLPALLLFLSTAFSQVPDAINYQAVLRDSLGMILDSQNVNLRINILKDNLTGMVVYNETFSITTNQYGSFEIAVGKGNTLTGDFDTIHWGSTPHFLKVEVDPVGGSNYIDLGTSQILSVPYAFIAEHAYGLTLTDINGIDYILGINTNGELVITSQGFSCGDTLTDVRNGEKYNTVQIGYQCWMADNLNIGVMILGTAVGTENSVIEKYCFANEQDSCEVYGALYSWHEMMDYSTTSGAKGICPDGWHVPGKEEWLELFNYLGGTDVAGGKMKETSFRYWSIPNFGADNSSGFTGIGGGRRFFYDGGFGDRTFTGDHWTSTQENATEAWRFRLDHGNADLGYFYEDKMNGLSVRCIAD